MGGKKDQGDQKGGGQLTKALQTTVMPFVFLRAKESILTKELLIISPHLTKLSSSSI